MPDGTIEIITGKERRRRWSVEEKLRIVAEADEPGARIAEVAARNEVYPSLLFSWRRQVREGRLVPNHRPQFVPVRMISAASENTAPPTRPATPHRGHAGGIEISLPDGTRLYIKREAQLPLLRPLIAALRG
jgi:transposase